MKCLQKIVFKQKLARHAAVIASVIIERENVQYKDEPKRPFRTRTLGLLQKTFKEKSNLKASEFRGFVAYICGLYKVKFELQTSF